MKEVYLVSIVGILILAIFYVFFSLFQTKNNKWWFRKYEGMWVIVEIQLKDLLNEIETNKVSVVYIYKRLFAIFNELTEEYDFFSNEESSTLSRIENLLKEIGLIAYRQKINEAKAGLIKLTEDKVLEIFSDFNQGDLDLLKFKISELKRSCPILIREFAARFKIEEK